MNLSKLSPREQLLALIVGVVVVLTLYGLLRLKPALAEMDNIRASITDTDKKIKTTTIPDPPLKSAEVLRREMKDMEAGIPQLKEDSKSLIARLAPQDSQELQILISDLARKNQLQIRERLPYDPAKAVAAPVPRREDMQASKLTQKRAKRAASKAMRTGKAAPQEKKVIAKKTGQTTELAKMAFEDIKNPPLRSLHDLPSTMSGNESLKRPLQRLVIEGSYRGLQRFIEDIEQLPWMVAVLKLDVAATGKEPPPGLPQPITATLVLSL